MKIRCSMAPRIAKCPGCFKMTSAAIAKFGPEQANEAMLRGTDYHQQMADIVKYGGVRGLWDASLDLGLDVTVRILASRAYATISSLGMQKADAVHVERHLPTGCGIPYLTAGFDWVGTADIILCDKEKNRILVMDYKSGMAAQEPAYEHPQLVAYACLAFFSAPALFCADPGRTLEVFGQIVPAAGKMYAPLIVDSENVQHALQQMVALAEEANEAEPSIEPGAHCGWCYAAGRTCEAFKETVSEAIVEAKGFLIPTVADDVLADAYMKAKQLSSLADSLNAELKRRVIDRGEPVAGYDIKLRKPTIKLSGDALVDACREFDITAEDLGVSINIKDIGEIVAKKLKVKKVDGLSLVEQKYLSRATMGEATQVLEHKD